MRPARWLNGITREQCIALYPGSNPGRASTAKQRTHGVKAILSIMGTLPILAPDLFGEFASRKNRIQNDCEQDYPTSCRQNREDHASFASH
jgi:hypothetical protein